MFLGYKSIPSKPESASTISQVKPDSDDFVSPLNNTFSFEYVN